MTRPGPALRARVAIAWTVALACGWAAIAAGNAGWRSFPRPRPLEELSYYPAGQFLQPAALGHAESAADLAWLRAVQYYGEHRITDNRFDRMPHVFDVLTSLAPGFLPPYVFGAFALAQEGGRFETARDLLEKGIRANPRNAELAFHMGFLHYVRPGGRDLRRAAEYFERSARLPGAPPQAARFAAFARQSAGDLRVAYALWQDVAERSPNRYLREIAERQMRAIREALVQNQPDRAMRKLATPRVIFR